MLKLSPIENLTYESAAVMNVLLSCVVPSFAAAATIAAVSPRSVHVSALVHYITIHVRMFVCVPINVYRVRCAVNGWKIIKGDSDYMNVAICEHKPYSEAHKQTDIQLPTDTHTHEQSFSWQQSVVAR